MMIALVAAQDTNIVYPTTAGPSATPLPNADGYTYAGCWNETIDVAGSGGVRALSEVGNFVSLYTRVVSKYTTGHTEPILTLYTCYYSPQTTP